jgi:hypothetical protein
MGRRRRWSRWGMRAVPGWGRQYAIGRGALDRWFRRPPSEVVFCSGDGVTGSYVHQRRVQVRSSTDEVEPVDATFSIDPEWEVDRGTAAAFESFGSELLRFATRRMRDGDHAEDIVRKRSSAWRPSRAPVATRTTHGAGSTGSS